VRFNLPNMTTLARFVRPLRPAAPNSSKCLRIVAKWRDPRPPQAARRMIREAFVPPKPKEFERTTSI
jgi:hypothetical protein